MLTNAKNQQMQTGDRRSREAKVNLSPSLSVNGYGFLTKGEMHWYSGGQCFHLNECCLIPGDIPPRVSCNFHHSYSLVKAKS